jgi:hypothetical protein
VALLEEMNKRAPLPKAFVHDGLLKPRFYCYPDISGCYGDREVFYLILGDRFLFINQGEEHEWTIRVASNPLKAIAAEERIIFHISAYGKFSSFLNSTQICI